MIQQAAAKLIRIKNISTPKQIPEGINAIVTRVIGHGTKNLDLDPFLMLDYFHAVTNQAFPAHPHRGFQAVTYNLEGQCVHEDFLGNKGIIGEGDLQWLTIGRGIVHGAMNGYEGKPTTGFQLWVNLPSVDKNQPPSYQEFKAVDLPQVSKDGTNIIVLAGEVFGQKSRIHTHTPIIYLDIRMQKNSSYEQQIPIGYNILIFIYQGEGKFGEQKQNAIKGQSIQFEKQNDRNELRVSTEGNECRFILLAGQPLNEPVCQHGPFVMNTQEELYKAIDDFQNQKNGFENSKNWTPKSIMNLVKK